MKSVVQQQFDTLKSLTGTSDYEIAFENFCKKYENDAQAKEEISRLIKEGMVGVGQRLERIAIRVQLDEIADMISLSYVARKYFNKTKAWLYQRINANTVNGKPAQFSEKEMETLKLALNDISKKIGSVSAILH